MKDNGHIRNVFQTYCDNDNSSCTEDDSDCIACALLWQKNLHQQELDRLKVEVERLKAVAFEAFKMGRISAISNGNLKDDWEQFVDSQKINAKKAG